MVQSEPTNPQKNNNKKRARVGPTTSQSRPIVADPNRPFALAPDDVVDKIFSFLPLRNVIQNGLVSRRFRESWLYTRRLVFDRQMLRTAKDGADHTATVDRLFAANRSDAIIELSLHFDYSRGRPGAIRGWVRLAAAKGLRELDLNCFASVQPYNLAPDFLDIATLRQVRLCHCKVKTKLSFPGGGLRGLTTLILRRVVLPKNGVEELIQQCEVLESLDVSLCYGFFTLNIAARERRRLRRLKIGGCPDLERVVLDAPWITAFFYEGQCKLLWFQEGSELPRLEEVHLGFTPSRAFGHCFKRVESFVTSSLPTASVLTATNGLLENLSPRFRNSMYRRFQCKLHNLKELQLYMLGHSFINLYDIISFASNCPALTKLFVDLNDFKFELGYYWEVHQRDDVDVRFRDSCKSLKFIKISGFKFHKHEMDLMRFLLNSSPNLKTLALISPKSGKYPFKSSDLQLLGGLFKAWNRAPEAKICVSNHWRDETYAPTHCTVWY